MRRGVADPSSSNYFNLEVLFNNLKLVPINSSTERALAVAVVDENGDIVPRADTFRANENHSSAQTNNVLKTAPGTGVRYYITDIIISNGATAGTVKIVEDASGTPADVLGPYYFGANSGMSKHFETPIPLSINKDLGFTSVTVTTHTITVSGYIAA